MKEIISRKVKCSLLSPVFLFSVGLMVINDHLLKGAGLLPQSITGKISDFAFVFFVPIVFAYVFNVKTKAGLYISCATVGGLFAAINVSAYFSRFVESLFHSVFLPLSLWPDPSDLIALTMIPCSMAFVLSERREKFFQGKTMLEFSIVSLCLITCVATSPVMRPTHEPIYMSWNDFRSSVAVTPPRDIMKRGKIYIKDNCLYVNEPNKGIHIFDNSNPEKPRAICFLNIPGNTDISIKDSYLYADSYVDLLVFALTIYPEDIVLVNRIEDVFPYNPHQNHPLGEGWDADSSQYIRAGYPDKKKGVVTGWRRIQER